MSSVTPASASIDDHSGSESVRAGERQLSLFRERHQGLRDPQLHAGVISAEIGSLESAMLYEAGQRTDWQHPGARTGFPFAIIVARHLVAT